MSICLDALRHGSTTALREACYRLRCYDASSVNRLTRRLASSPTLGRTAAPIPEDRYGYDLSAGASKRKHDNLINKELFLHVLGSTATKREAKSYLSRFGPEKPKQPKSWLQEAMKDNVGVNLGNLYLPLRAVDQSPVFDQGPSKARYVDQAVGPLHIALVKIRDPQAIDDSTLEGVGLTLVQLSRLGMSCVTVIDCKNGQHEDHDLRRMAIEQADRLAAAIDYHGGPGARRLDNVLVTSKVDKGLPSSSNVSTGTHITDRRLLFSPLRKGKISVLAPIAFDSTTLTLVHLPADKAILALTRDFAGLRPGFRSNADRQVVAENIKCLQKEVSLDRIILLDPLGGIPAVDRHDQSHIFINLEQEYDTIKSELSNPSFGELRMRAAGIPSVHADNASLSSTSTKPISGIWESQSSLNDNKRSPESRISVMSHEVSGQAEVHLQNLELLRDTLAILPSSSSGLLTTPEKAANADQRPTDSSFNPGVGTRRHRNPLIHNLLTDKPILSSSLPPSRTQQPTLSQNQTPLINPATFVKRGMPISIYPDPRIHPWAPPPQSNSSIPLSDPCIDLPRLIHLIEDSFNRKLDVPHYLSRIQNRIAGIIIAGDYEGGALLTWESPAHNPSAVVPYLDKLAVLKRSQGAGGVADIVFKAMVRTCFPNGVCWRSRRDNPVNKWYFERAKGTWKIPGSNWTMFWTTEGVQVGEGKGVFGDYEAVCRGVVPSWGDGKGVVD
ncbi:MAG: hypothetical protein Q9182_003041 [Xanthomendoza sp. 2 TL-2023]